MGMIGLSRRRRGGSRWAAGGGGGGGEGAGGNGGPPNGGSGGPLVHVGHMILLFLGIVWLNYLVVEPRDPDWSALSGAL